MRIAPMPVALVLGLVTGTPAPANDSTAILEAGGLQLVPTGAIGLESEDLTISPREISVRYRFLNRTDQDRTTLVAFPLPEIDMSLLEYGPVEIPVENSDNFVGFSVTVEGRSIEPMVEHRILALGIDRTDMLRDDGIPLAPFDPRIREMLKRLPTDRLAEYERIGLVQRSEADIIPYWRARTTFYWEETFPAGRPLRVEHRYQPIVGHSFFYVESQAKDVYFERYCMDDGFLRAARKKADSNGLMLSHEVRYVLTTAANWAGTIGRFRLEIDKTDPEWLVSLCGSGISKTGPSTFVMDKTDFYPEKDLEILFLQKPPKY